MEITQKLTEDIRNRVAKTIKDRPKKKSRIQVNASFSKAEYGVLSRGSAQKGVSPARLIKDLALQSLGNSPNEIQAELGAVLAGIQETSQLLRQLYRDSNAWQRWELKELRPLLRRLLQLERKASNVLQELTKSHAD